jgi:acetoin utilization deacetylase AcuC-like enzyme
MGFCFLNNAGIAAKYAQEKYGLHRVAILVSILTITIGILYYASYFCSHISLPCSDYCVEYDWYMVDCLTVLPLLLPHFTFPLPLQDFDVHHGNGSAHGFVHDPSIFYGSTHEKDNYPGTGREPYLIPVPIDEIVEMRDELGDELFAAICGDLSGPAPFDMPATAGMKITVAEENDKRRIVDRTIVANGALSRRSFRLKWREVVYEMVRFKPQLVIISAGFDAHKRDPLASLDLQEEDFEWATKLVMDACRCCGDGKRRMASETASVGG